MRIISGLWKGRRIKELKGFHSRPTTDFAKEGLFNVLEHSINIQELKVLDLFTGTGNISFEFISRGAQSVFSIDSNFSSIQFVKKTSKLLNAPENKHHILKLDALKYLNKTEDKFNLIFADPPFEYNEYEKLIHVIKELKILKDEGTLIIEHFKKVDLSDFSGYQKSHLFGNVCFSFFNFEQDE
ncbi:MAG: 16S rRNA (guanine(966)-N(2))-methyltransferase RsmD [Crocinitomicaceae bacterium]|jgi:16S rRNA (guanine966-N2)-methyltransferase|nr:16S rRNA (guanine(966)-N(2))-methyltransferase RsmD [Crocinitomicaceae bacterium]